MKLAIVGTHPDTRSLAPWDDSEYTIWVFNEAPQARWCKRWDACFQLHRPEVYTSPKNFVNAEHWDWLQQPRSETIYMQAVDERVPGCVRYPIEDVINAVAFRRYLTSSAAYALALALTIGGWDEIGVWGIQLSSNTEYSYQLNGWMYWTGVADGRGVKLVLHSGEEHFSSSLYGYDGETQIPKSDFRSALPILRSEHQSAERNLQRQKSDFLALTAERKFGKIPAAIQTYFDAAIEAGKLSGLMTETEFYANRDDIIPRQEYERRLASARQTGEIERTRALVESGKAEYVYNVWSQTGSDAALQQFRSFVLEQARYGFQAGACTGIAEVNTRCLARYDELITAAGGARTLAALGLEVL